MRRTRRTSAFTIVAATTAAALSLSLGTATMAGAQPDDQKPPAAKGLGGELENVGPNYNAGKKMPMNKASLRKAKAAAGEEAAATASPQARTSLAAADTSVGEVKQWLALDDNSGRIYLKDYTLRGVGDHIQVWVADDRAFPEGDCRNTLGLTDITDDQVNGFVNEFDTNIYPKESESFSVPPSRDGSDSPLGSQLGDPSYYQVDADQADDIVVLVDNVRDANFSAPNTPDGQTYIAGFFYSVFNEYVNRNVMTIDAFDWLHRTGANPPDDTANQDYIDCANALGQTRAYGAPRPHTYEGTFAHEYQHLLEYYEDPDETNWINEGLSDYAQSLVGYVDTSISPDQENADGHIKCFQGFQPENFGGPENSLTLWGDQGGPEILCDYGAAYSFMQYLNAHYGEKFMSALHTDDLNGLESLDAVLDQFGSKKSAMESMHDWMATTAIDAALDKGRKLTGGNMRDYTADTLSGLINWDNPQAYDSPGAPPNGSDYVRLRAGHRPLAAKDIKSITFSGSKSLAPEPVEWEVSATPPDATTADTTCGAVEAGTGPAALYSGCGENLDRSITREVTVPASGGQLSFDTLFDTEVGWDAGFAQVSTDGGKTWTSLASEDTTTEHDPGAIAAVVENLPGFTGDSGTWKTQHADLSAYAGQTVLLGFRYISDPGVNEGGFFVRNIDVAGTAVPATLDGWQTISQVNPPQVQGWTVQLVGYDAKGKSFIYRLPLSSTFSGNLTSAMTLNRAIGKQATTVAAIVTQDDPTETVTKYAQYELKVNGQLQPGGS